MLPETAIKFRVYQLQSRITVRLSKLKMYHENVLLSTCWWWKDITEERKQNENK